MAIHKFLNNKQNGKVYGRLIVKKSSVGKILIYH